MFDYLSQNSLYIVLLIALVVWFGIYVFMFRIERRIKRLEKHSDTKSS